MTTVCVFILIFSTLYAVEPVGRCVSAQSLPEPPVYQPDKELSVDIGDSATLPCCISTKQVGIIDFFKQPNRQKIQIMVTVYKTGSETFHHGFQKFRYQIGRSSTCFNLTILNTTGSDEATYYCAVTRPNIVFAEGTYLKIKVVCKETLHGNITIISTQEKTVATTENTPRKGQAFKTKELSGVTSEPLPVSWSPFQSYKAIIRTVLNGKRLPSWCYEGLYP
ncbi:putative immune-type receptor 13 isoform 2 precursor [Silurus asotus]|uniref:Immune-type receptor 13 isoform 2 n=1 Tax=Silurus asotus TaxID=30991 RepID=A0AAD5FPU5_SILAS|nr:putative immune-type receptor 13 isoform 2 precursor [Silurus asotus]